VKVCELKEGMLVRAAGNWEIMSCCWPAYFPKEGTVVFEERKNAVEGITIAHAWKRIAKKEIMMFVGTTQDDFQWGGVKRHHRFLWNGKGVIMTGYDMRHIEKMEDER